MIGKKTLSKFAILCLLLTFSCGDSKGKKDKEDPNIEADAGMDGEEDPAGIFQTKITPELLLPVIQSVGSPDVVPQKIVIQFAMDIQPYEASSRSNPKAVPNTTRLKIEPEIPGSLTFTSSTSLEFKPNTPFLPQTKYKVSLISVDTLDGLMKPAKPWSMEFRTPEFRFLSVSGGFLKPDAHKAEVDIRFSGALKPNLSSFAKWYIDDKAIPSSAISYVKGATDHLVHAYVSHPDIAENRTLKLEVDKVPSAVAENIIAPKGLAFVHLRAAPELKILQVSHREGPTGFYLEVVCYDNGAKRGYRYFYTHDYNSFRVSKRCLPTEDSFKKLIKISPKVDNLRVAAGEGGFNILGDFKRGNYNLRIEAGLQSVDKGLVTREYVDTFTIPARTPTLRFTNKGRYLPKKSWKTIPLQTLNTPKVNVALRYIPIRNIAFWLSGDKEALGTRVSSVVAKEKIELKSKADEKSIQGIAIHDLVKDPKPGVYEIFVAGPKGASDSTRVVVTDLNLIVKRSEPKKGDLWSDEIMVWVLDMETSKAKPGVQIKLIRQNGNVYSSCKTKNNGSCKLDVVGKDIDEDPPFAILAEAKNDFTFLKYDQVKTSPTTTGTPYLSKEKYRAAVYADRDVYRPGETGHFVAVIRTSKDKAPKEGLPVELKFYDPRKKFLKLRILQTNAAGAVIIDQHFPDFASTGAYSFDVQIGKELLKSYTFNVEEFVPERMKVSTEIKGKDHLIGEPLEVDIQAKYLFGGSAKGSKVEVTCKLATSQFKPKKFSNYTFGSEIGDKSAIELGAIKGVLGEEGKLKLACPDNEATDSRTGVFNLTATTAVFEAGSGRSSSSITKTTMHANSYHIGLKTSAKNAKVGTPFLVDGVIVDWKGKIKKDIKELNVEFIRLEYDYYWYRDDSLGGDSWGRNMRPITVGTKRVRVKNGRFQVSMTPSSYASRFVVRVQDKNAKADISVEASGWRYYYYNHRSSLDYTPRPQRPNPVPINAPTVIEINKEVEVEFEVPFAGRMLVSVETSSILKSEWMDVKAGKVKWKYKLEKFVPNIYFSALVVKDPFLDSKESFMPDRAYGLKSVMVKPTTKVHELLVNAPKEVRPNSTFEVDINVGKASANTFVTVAAIDEGILSLTHYKTPKLSQQLFKKRKLGVETFETIGWAIQRNGAGPSAQTGGGAWDEDGKFGDGLGRVMPVKPVALWSGLVKVDDQGKAKVSFDVPTYRGALRIMAVSMDEKKTGSAETEVLVRDPLVLQATLPRFLSADDEISIPVFVTNMTGKDKNITIEIQVEDMGISGEQNAPKGKLLSFLSPQSVTLSAKNEESQTAIFRVKALRQAGAARFKVIAKAPGFESYTEGEVPFRPSGPRETMVKVAELTQGKTEFNSFLKGWVPTSETTNIWVTTNPYGRAFDHLKYVIRYPYGCIEQTTSSTRPLLFVSEFVKNADPETLAKLGGVEKMIAAGIRRIFSMQTSSGGFSYWPGSYSPDRWGTAYATDMLLDAKEKGFDVPEERLKEALDYLEMTAQNSSSRSRYNYSLPYMHYVLAKAGRANRAKIQSLINRKSFKDSVAPGASRISAKQKKENTYLLQAALYLAGDRRYEKQLKNVDISKIDDERETRWSYYSDRRRRAFILSVFYDLFGKHADGEKLAKVVANSLSERKSRYYTTQEISWGITGLGKWLKGSAKSMGTPSLKINGQKVNAKNVAKISKDSTWVIPRASEYDSIVINVPKKNGKVYAIVSSSGVRVGAEAKIGGNGLKINRVYFDLSGKELEPDAYTLGDIAFVRITITNTTNRNLSNLALVDRFAGGFEVENPSFGRGTLPSWVNTNQLWKVQHMNVRDDRIEVFGTINAKRTVTLMYTVRAVAAGKFFAPPPEIEGMYEPEMWAREKPSIVKVSRE